MKINFFLLLVCIILLSVIVYQQTPRYQYEVKMYDEERQFKKKRKARKIISESIRRHDKAVRDRIKERMK